MHLWLNLREVFVCVVFSWLVLWTKEVRFILSVDLVLKYVVNCKWLIFEVFSILFHKWKMSNALGNSGFISSFFFFLVIDIRAGELTDP